MTSRAEYQRLYVERRACGLTPLTQQRVPAESLLSALAAVQRRLPKSLEKAVWRARRSGSFTVLAADEICVGYLGVHPVDVFGAEWFA